MSVVCHLECCLRWPPEHNILMFAPTSTCVCSGLLDNSKNVMCLRVCLFASKIHV